MHVYATEHISSRTVCKAFAEGAGAKVVAPAPLRPGDVAMYGCLRGLEPTLRQAQKEGRNWYYIDNGYINPGHFDGYFRVTRCNYQIDGRGVSNGQRLSRLPLHVKPWRTDGRHIVFCPPSPTWCDIVGLDLKAFMKNTHAALRARTRRPIVVRAKPTEQALAADLVNAWCLLTYSSNAAVEAAIAGIPVVCLGHCAAYAIGGTIDEIEAPPMPPRAGWLGVLADNQWNLDEMRDGTCWDQLREQF